MVFTLCHEFDLLVLNSDIAIGMDLIGQGPTS